MLVSNLQVAILLAIAAVPAAQQHRPRKHIYKKVLTADEAELWGARALDGSPYAYYVSDTSATGPRDWIVYLDGGGECESHSDCVKRIRTQGSSTHLANSLDPDRDVSDGMTGKTRDANPDFYEFGTLFLPYLSGDDWLGRQTVACVPWGKEQNCSRNGNTKLRPLYFSGHNNFEAAILHWLQHVAVKPRSVLLSGGSAGGQGAYFHADRLAEMLPDITVKANPQYGWFGAPTDMFHDWRKGLHTDPAIPYPSSGSPVAVPPWVYNISVFLPKNCLATLAAHESQFLCTSLPRVALTVDVPLFVSTNLFDGWLTSEMEQVPSGRLGLSPASDPKLDYMLNVTAPSQRRTVMKAMRVSKQSSNAAFVPACFEHPMEWTLGSQSYPAPVLGRRNCTHGAAVASWFFDRGDCERVLVDYEDRPEVLANMACNRGVFKSRGVFDMPIFA